MWRVRLSTAQDQSTFTEQLDFIADNGAWRVEELPPSEGLDDPFGLFADAPGTPTDDSGFGFFEPLPAAELGAESASAPAGEEGDGFGLFAPLPSPAAAPPASSVEEEGDGFGFFAPLHQSRLLHARRRLRTNQLNPTLPRPRNVLRQRPQVTLQSASALKRSIN